MSTTTTTSLSHNHLKWLSLGDWGHTGTLVGGNVSIQELIADKIDALKKADPSIKFLVTSGDNFYEKGVSGLPFQYTKLNDEEKQQYLSHLEAHSTRPWKSPDPIWTERYINIFRNKTKRPYCSDLPWYVCLGNHDHYGSITAQIAYSYLDREKKWNIEAPYYCRRFYIYPDEDASGTKRRFMSMIVIDTYALRNFGSNRRLQKEWLLKALKHERARNSSCIMVVGHYPLYSEGAHCSRNLNVDNHNIDGSDSKSYNNSSSNGPRSRSSTLKGWLLKTFIRYGVDLYVCGHNHNLEYSSITSTENGHTLHHIVSGSGSKLQRPGDGPSLCSSVFMPRMNHINSHYIVSKGQPLYRYGFVEHTISTNPTTKNLEMEHKFHYLSNTTGPLQWKNHVITTPINKWEYK